LAQQLRQVGDRRRFECGPGEVVGVGRPGPVDPRGAKSRAVSAVDIPGVDCHEHHVHRLDAALLRRVRVRARCRLPHAGVLDREQPFEVLADSGPLKQVLGNGGCPVAQGDKAGVQGSESGYAVTDVLVDAQLAEASHDVVDRLVDGAVQGQASEADVKNADAELGKWCGTAGGGERETVAQEAGEPRRGQVCGGSDVDEPLAHG